MSDDADDGRVMVEFVADVIIRFFRANPDALTDIGVSLGVLERCGPGVWRRA